MSVAFYTVANSGYFLCLTGLVNSLRLTGHTAPIVVLDAGLTDAQRAALAGECEFVPAPPLAVTNPALWKAAAPHTRPADLIVMIDSDIVVTGSLESILESARQGQICAYPDPDHARWFAEWDAAFGLPPMRRQTYVNTGFVAISTRVWPHFVERWWELCRKIRNHPTLYEGAPNGPTSQADQDAFNALMMSEYPAGAVVPMSGLEAPLTHQAIRDEVEVVDERTFSCVRQGVPVRFLHWSYKPKPWAPEARAQNQYHAYSRLLVRATTWSDAPVRLPMSAIPWWMRPDPVSRVRALLRRHAGLAYRSAQRFVSRRPA